MQLKPRIPAIRLRHKTHAYQKHHSCRAQKTYPHVPGLNSLPLFILLAISRVFQFLDGEAEKKRKSISELENQENMDAQKIAHRARRAPPNLLKEICYGLTIGLVAGGLWKIHHWDYKRRTKEFYGMLERGEISVVVDEE